MVIGAVSTVAGILIAQFIGAEDTKEAWCSFDVSLISGIVISALFLFAAGVFPSQILGLYTKGCEYCKYWCGLFQNSSVFLYSNGGQHIFSSMAALQGACHNTIFGGLGRVAVNTGLNYLLIFGKFGFHVWE